MWKLYFIARSILNQIVTEYKTIAPQNKIDKEGIFRDKYLNYLDTPSLQKQRFANTK